MSSPSPIPGILDFFVIAADMLELPQTALSTSLLYFHRYQQFCSGVHDLPGGTRQLDIDEYLIATSCIHLATKTTENPRKLRDVINVCYKIVHPDEDYLKISDSYWRLRDSLSSVELLLLRILNFDLNVGQFKPSPYLYMLNYISCIFPGDEIHTFGTVVSECAWTFINDTFLSDICLRYQAKDIAATSIYFAIDVLELPQPFGIPFWWRNFNVTDNKIKAIFDDMVKFYQQESS